MKRINVEINDLKYYTSVCLFVDQDDFLKQVEDVRKVLGIKKLYTRKAWTKWFDDIGRRGPEQKKLRHVSFKKLINLAENDDSLTVKDILVSLYYLDALLVKFKKPYAYSQIIYYSIFCGNVINKDLYFFDAHLLTNHSRRKDYKFSLDAENAFIEVSPDTTLQQVKNKFALYKRKIKTLDTFSNIKRDREWYWLKKSGLSYSEIQHKALSLKEKITRDGVIKAIKQYERLLLAETSTPIKPLQKLLI